MQKELGFLIAALALSALVVAPIERHPYPLDPRLRLLATCLVALWSSWRLWSFVKARKRWNQWQRSASWSVKGSLSAA